MGLLLSVPDVLGVIYHHSQNPAAFMASNVIWTTACCHGTVCQTCHKLVSVFQHPLWITDPDDHAIISCHGYYGDLDYYKQKKEILIKYPAFLKYIQRQCKTLNYYAVKQNSMMIQYVRHPTELLADFAFLKNEDAIQFVKQTPERCDHALRQNGLLLKYIKQQTLNLCWTAVCQTVTAFQYVDACYQTDDMIAYVIQRNVTMFRSIKQLKEQHYILLYQHHPHYFTVLMNDNHNGSSNTCFGYQSGESLTDGHHNTFIGHQSGQMLTTGSNSVMIGNSGLSTDTDVIRIGSQQRQNYQAGIFGACVKSNAVAVLVDSSGQLGTCSGF